MKAAIISIGNELLNGRTVNSNATFIAEKFFEIGVAVDIIYTIRDEKEKIVETLETALQKVPIVVITGGLGPTHDDITKTTLADYFKKPLIYREEIVQKIEQRFRERGLVMPESNRVQGYVPEGARLIDNAVGTAPGMHFQVNEKHVFALPGVPREMKYMITNDIAPFLQKTFGLTASVVKVFRTTRIAESAIYERCKDFIRAYSDFEIAFLPKFTGVDIRVLLPKTPESQVRFEKFRQQIEAVIGKYIYTTDERELPEVVGDLLQQKHYKVSVAESCTGGLIQHLITSVAGSSAYFWGGVVSYSNESKMKILGVSDTVLQTHGAVSEQTARQMAEGVRKLLGVEVGISSTGIAGPGGGTPEKPVGLVYLGLATPDGTHVKKFNLGKDRHINQQQSAIFALDMLRRWLTGLPV
jgi:nicotinamide-nucleotide amidase